MTAIRLPVVRMYTDGACDPNPGPGGWAAILLREGSEPVRLSGSQKETTNNQMELRAAIEGLRALTEPHQVILMTDSQYLSDGASQRVPNWERDGWPTEEAEVKNLGFWRELAEALRKHHVEWRWVRGHNGDRLNEEADVLAQSMVPHVELPLTDENAIHVFTGASCVGAGNGPAGWGVELRHRAHSRSLSGCEASSSSERMQLLAALRGLEAIELARTIKPMKSTRPVHLYTTSKYLCDGVMRWAEGWQQRGWKTKEGQSVKHRDLWEPLIGLSDRLHVTWHVVRDSDHCPLLGDAKALAVTQAREAAGATGNDKRRAT
jgi:ribonuclease HI